MHRVRKTSGRRADRAVRGLASLLLVLPLAQACAPDDPAPATSVAPAPSTPVVELVDVAAEVGLAVFQQVSGGAEKMDLVSSTAAAGVALFDYDGDDALDVFLINGSRLGGFPAGSEPTNRLFRNQGGGASFVDVTAASGLDSSGAWGQGCAVADVDADGHLDLYVTNYGANALYMNRGDGTFEEIARVAGVDTDVWSTGAAFFDYDRDGDLDLYLANYLRYEEILEDPERQHLLTTKWKGLNVAGGPRGLPAGADQLFRNDGPSAGLRVRFTDVTEQVGMAAADPAYGFQPILGDYDGDGFLDLFVPNDSMANFLWRNLAGRSFEEVGIVTGVAFDQMGNKQASMGVAFEDHDGDGLLDLFITNFADDYNTLYSGSESGLYFDRTAGAGLRDMKTRHSLAWGTFFFDVDNDGKLDLFVANGHIYPQIDEIDSPESFAQPNQLLLSSGDGRFRDISEEAGSGMAILRSSRGAAFGDLDDDGDLDLVINNVDTSPTVLRNDSRPERHWIKVLLRGGGRNPSAIGARLRVEAAGATQSRYARSSDSFLSHHDLRLHIGLGDTESIDRLVVDWPDGSTETIPGSAVDVLLIVEQGKGVIYSGPLRPSN